MDQPRRLRPLGSGLDQSGAARPPSELLDELRLRLSSLPGNHPSSTRGAAQDRVRADWTGARSGPDQGGPGEPPVPGEGNVAREPVPGGHTDAASDRAGTIPPGPEGGPDASGWAPFQWPDAWTAELPLGWRDETDAYRPWFMSGEPAAPWFAAPDS
jgi:hypothetical protein